MNKSYFSAFFPVLTLAAVSVVGPGCVQQRPSRNGVFNENQYVRKDFLIRNADGKSDPGWMLKATVTEVSTPDPLGDVIGIFAGTENGGAMVRFVVTQDKLQMLSMREMSSVASPARIPEVVNSWPVTNVDLKYRVNLDGEKTNFYEENQELDWQVRQWVKINFAKNDMSDVAPLGTFTSDLLSRCTDIGNASATLVPDSFQVDEKNDYMQWKVQIATPLKWDDEACVQAFGELGNEALRLNRQTVTFNLMYSMVRADPNPSYKPLVVAEKDPIRHKYGPIETVTIDRDETSGLLAARQLAIRFDPQKPKITWYFAKGFPNGKNPDGSACATCPDYTKVFTDPGGVADQTNAILKQSNAKAQVEFKNYDADLAEGESPREYGDIRYNFLRWVSDKDMQSFWAGVTQFVVDPRTGEALSSSINFNDFAIKDYYVQRIDAYLQMVGAAATDYDPSKPAPDDGKTHVGVNSAGEWIDPGACKDGDTMPIVAATAATNHNGSSALYQKMQIYLQKPPDQFGPLGPQDFIVNHDNDMGDFYRAYYALTPYYIFSDPDMNPFVIREGGAGVLGPDSVWKMLQDEAKFQKTAALIDQGLSPYEDATGPNGLQNALGFLNNFRDLSRAHQQYTYAKSFFHKAMHMDAPSSFSFEGVMARDARHCINGKWETKEEWVSHLIDTYWSQVIWHEFGHSMGLEHNFMASVDEPNFPHYKDGQNNDHIGLYASSVMEYNAAPDRVFWHAGWAPHDVAALGWMYGNDAPAPGYSCNGPNDKNPCPTGSTCTVAPMSPSSGTCVASSITGQIDAKTPWNDQFGFGKWTYDTGTKSWTQAPMPTESVFLYCNEYHLKYTPLCRQGDIGRTPSEIVANAIDSYEWQYQWRNFRLYRKIWDNSAYADAPAGTIMAMRRFLSLWAFDWSSSELADSLRRIGIKNPDPMSSDLEYYTALTNKFNADISGANQMIAAFHKAVIQMSAGERPYKTIYDKFYGDTTQQGIILDKLFAMQGWVGLWPTDNYDQNQAGSYISSWSTVGDDSYGYVAQDAAVSMIGGQYDVYPYFVPLAVAQFAQDTHSPSFSGNPSVRDWIGGHTFTRLQDFLDFFKDVAVQNNYEAAPGEGNCDAFETCKYDPRPYSDTHNEFIGPDKRSWIWAYIPDRNQYIAVQKERNTATYLIVRNYNDYFVYQLDDGAFPGGVYGAELPMKYTLDSFTYFN